MPNDTTRSDPFNIDFTTVEQSVKQDDRRAVRLPGFCVIVLDRDVIDHAFIRHFDDTPLGYHQAMKWAVRMEEEDIHSEKTVEQLREDYKKELESTRRIGEESTWSLTETELGGRDDTTEQSYRTEMGEDAAGSRL